MPRRLPNALSVVPAWVWLAGIVCRLDRSISHSRASLLQMPIVFRDELVYSNAAKRLAAGLPPAFDGSSYGYGLVYPLFIAPFYRLFAHTDGAYTAIKVANAAVFCSRPSRRICSHAVLHAPGLRSVSRCSRCSCLHARTPRSY